jgi:hypothetical protein
VDEEDTGVQGMKSNYTEDEISQLTAWALRMIKFWGVIALLYIAIFCESTLALWILGSLAVMKGIEKLNEGTESND